jgi:hypothetical protein
MKRDSSPLSVHLSGEQLMAVATEPPRGVDLYSFFGPIRVEWDHEAAMMPLGQFPFFIDFLKTTGLLDALVGDCPLRYLSPNAPRRRDVLATAMPSMLAGHKRYAHIAALRCDAVLPELLGMKKIVSEDAIRRAFKAIDEKRGSARGLEPATAYNRAQAAPDRRGGAFARRREGRPAAFVRRDRRGDGGPRILGSGHLAR